MSKVITFSVKFPTTHPRAGQPTYFVEKLFASWRDCIKDWCTHLDHNSLVEVWPKHHTIRAGNRFKEGDKFSPRVWSAKPYASKQIILSEDIEIVKIFTFHKSASGLVFVNGKILKIDNLKELAKNDGLAVEDFCSWFDRMKTFQGQVICWNRNIKY